MARSKIKNSFRLHEFRAIENYCFAFANSRAPSPNQIKPIPDLKSAKQTVHRSGLRIEIRFVFDRDAVKWRNRNFFKEYR